MIDAICHSRGWILVRITKMPLRGRLGAQSKSADIFYGDQVTEL